MRVLFLAMLWSAGCAHQMEAAPATNRIEAEHEKKLLEPNQRHAFELDERAPVKEVPAR